MLEITNKDFCKRKIKEVLILHNSLKYLGFKIIHYSIYFSKNKIRKSFLFVISLSKTFL